MNKYCFTDWDKCVTLMQDTNGKLVMECIRTLLPSQLFCKYETTLKQKLHLKNT